MRRPKMITNERNERVNSKQIRQEKTKIIWKSIFSRHFTVKPQITNETRGKKV